MTNTEIWQPVSEYGGAYLISNHGRVKSVSRIVREKNGKARQQSGQFLKLNKGSKGYSSVILSKHGARQAYTVHRLVLETFVGPCPAGKECAHEDGDRLNNRLNNLSWKTRKDNCFDKMRHGTQQFGEHCSYSKLTEDDVREIRLIHVSRSFEFGAAALARKYNVNRNTVRLAIVGPNWKYLV